MSVLVKAAITEKLLALNATSTIPSAPFGYGSDIWGESDLSPQMEEISETALVVAQYAVRRLGTPKGTLPDDPNWGIDLSTYCNRPTTWRELASLESEIESELLDDDRVDQVRAQVSSSGDGVSLSVRLLIVPEDPNSKSFTLTLSVSPIEILIEELA